MKMNLCTLRITATIPTQSYGNIILEAQAEFMDVNDGEPEDVIRLGFKTLRQSLLGEVAKMAKDNPGVKTWLQVVDP